MEWCVREGDREGEVLCRMYKRRGENFMNFMIRGKRKFLEKY